MLATQDVCDFEAPVELTLRERLIARARGMAMDHLLAQDAAEFAATQEYELDGSVSPIDWSSNRAAILGLG